MGRLKYLLWREEQNKKVAALRNRSRCVRARIKWAREARRWEHEHPVRGA